MKLVSNVFFRVSDGIAPNIPSQTNLFKGLNKYFSDMDDYEFSIHCDECSNEKLKYLRTTSNNEVHWCEKCESEQITPIKPNEDNY